MDFNQIFPVAGGGVGAALGATGRKSTHKPLVKPTTRAMKKVYRFTFEMRREGIGSVMLHTLMVNPEDFTQEEPARNTVTPTLGGAYVTDFGMGLPTVSVSGTTGYKTRTTAEGEEMDGYEQFLAFRRRVYRSFIESNDPLLSLYWYNWEDNEFYEIQPTSFRLQRSKSQSLLYRYDLRFTCIRRLTKTRSAMAQDYLLANPDTRQLTLDLSKSISSYSEIMNLLRSGG